MYLKEHIQTKLLFERVELYTGPMNTIGPNTYLACSELALSPFNVSFKKLNQSSGLPY